MAFVLTNDQATQLVALDLESDTTNNIEGLSGTIADVDGYTGVVDDVEGLTGVIDAVCGTAAGFAIDSFATSVGVQEIGAIVATPAFTAAYSLAPDLVELDDSDGTPTKDVTATPNAFTSDGTFQKTANNAVVTFTLSAERNAVQDSAQASIAWRPRTYWGAGGAALLTEAEIEALTGNHLDSNYATTFSLGAAGPTTYGWYCFPQSYDPGDAAQFQVGPFVGGWQKIGVVSVTNPNGVTQDYACWRTDNPGLGAIDVTVF